MPLSIFVKENADLLKLKGQDVNQPCPSSNQVVKPTSLQNIPVLKKAVDRRQKRKSKIPIRKQFKVRLIGKPLPHTTNPEATATTAAATQPQ